MIAAKMKFAHIMPLLHIFSICHDVIDALCTMIAPQPFRLFELAEADAYHAPTAGRNYRTAIYALTHK